MPATTHSRLQAYNAADEVLKANLPGMIQAIFALMPRLVHALCMVQNTLLGHYYTALHDFCQQHGYLIPTPEWTQVQTEFDDAFGAAKRDTERLSTLQRGKAVKTEFYSRPDSLQTRTVSHRTNSAGSSGMLAPTRSNGRLPPPVPAPGAGGVTPPPPIDLSTRPRRRQQGAVDGGRQHVRAAVAAHVDGVVPHGGHGAVRLPLNAAHVGRRQRRRLAPLGLAADVALPGPGLELRRRRPGHPPRGAVVGGGADCRQDQAAAPAAADAAARAQGAQQDWVVAQYDFAGEGEGDLSFREGDRIRVVVRTASTNDWWEGECGGARGSFPANYCRPFDVRDMVLRNG